jgi:hypothetical protein
LLIGQYYPTDFFGAAPQVAARLREFTVTRFTIALHVAAGDYVAVRNVTFQLMALTCVDTSPLRRALRCAGNAGNLTISARAVNRGQRHHNAAGQRGRDRRPLAASGRVVAPDSTPSRAEVVCRVCTRQAVPEAVGVAGLSTVDRPVSTRCATVNGKELRGGASLERWPLVYQLRRHRDRP